MCTRSYKAYRNPNGGRPIFGWEGIKSGLPEIELPCGKCPECQKDYYTMWATRGSRELSRWDSSVFITLTYDDQHLPADNSLKKKDVQDFLKRLKFKFGSTKENPIRQIYCGEYGANTKRPHYHAIIFNCDFTDKKQHYKTSQGHQVYRSQTLSDLWGLGFAEFGYATPGSIAYLFKYILKKKTKKEQEQPLVIERDGVTYEVAHEFIEASRNPGIGAHLKNSKSLAKGFLTVDGVKKKIPKYYMEDLRVNNPKLFDEISNMRFDFMQDKPKESRLRKEQKEEAQKALTDRKNKM